MDQKKTLLRCLQELLGGCAEGGMEGCVEAGMEPGMEGWVKAAS